MWQASAPLLHMSKRNFVSLGPETTDKIGEEAEVRFVGDNYERYKHTHLHIKELEGGARFENTVIGSDSELHGGARF